MSSDRVIPVILTRGWNRRSATDKALITWEGRPLIEHSLAALLRLPGEPLIVTKRPAAYRAYEEHGIEIVPDRHEAETPISGILTAGEIARERGVAWILVTGADTVPLREDLFELLWEERLPGESVPAVLPEIAGVPQPIPALYHAKTMISWRRAFRNRRFHLTPIAASLSARRVRFAEPPYLNINETHHLDGASRAGA